MLNRATNLQSISSYLSKLQYEISIRGAINLYDINIVSESFFATLLNKIEGFNLTNKNVFEKNAQAIDLADDDKRISVQVTSDNTSTKIKHTIEGFLQKQLYVKYDRLIILILADKKNYTTTFDTHGKFQFDNKRDIWDIKTLIQKINKLSDDQVRDICEYLEKELGEKNNKKSEANEVETIIALMEFISTNKKIYKERQVTIDPNYKFNTRFKDFANRLENKYCKLYITYGTVLAEIEKNRESDDAQDLVAMMYLEEKSIYFLDESNNNPINALNALADFFEEKISKNGRKYDRMAIEFYLLDRMIKCSVFPNETGETC